MAQLSSHPLNNSVICWYKRKQTSALFLKCSPSLALHPESRKVQGCRGQCRWGRNACGSGGVCLLEGSAVGRGLGVGGDVISQTKCQHTLHLLSLPISPLTSTARLRQLTLPLSKSSWVELRLQPELRCLMGTPERQPSLSIQRGFT